MRLVSIVLFMVAATFQLSYAGDAATKVRVALALANATPAPVFKQEKPLTYVQGQLVAIATKKPLWVYVGIPSKPNEDAVVCETASLSGFGYPEKCVIVSKIENGILYWDKTLDPNHQELKEVSQKAEPFRPVLIFQQSRQSNCST